MGQCVIPTYLISILAAQGLDGWTTASILVVSSTMKSRQERHKMLRAY